MRVEVLSRKEIEPQRTNKKRTLLTGILLWSALAAAAFPKSVSVDFNRLSGADGTPFHTYTESGFTVSPGSSMWLVNQDFGNPPPFIYFTNSAGNAITAGVSVKDGGSDFSFSSIDLYSSITEIPYTFTGVLNGRTAFTVSGTVPNTFGNFATVENPDSRVMIDMLEVTLTDPLVGCCDNPVGLDNIVLVTPSSSVSEPTTLLLLPTGLLLLGCLRARLSLQDRFGCGAKFGDSC